MSDLDVQLKYKNKNGGYDNLYPRTKGDMVQMNDGRNAEQVLDEVTDLYNQVIEDGTISDVNSAPEIIASRVDSKGVTHPNLKSRLDQFEFSTTAQLQQKATKDQVRFAGVKLEPEDLSENTLGLITGQGVVNLLSEPQNASVTHDKLSNGLDGLIIHGKNLFNPDDPDILYYKTFNSSAEIVDSETHNITGYIKVNPYDKLIYSHSGGGQWVFSVWYDSGKNRISGRREGSTFHEPGVEGAEYVRFAFPSSHDLEKIQIEKNETRTSYEPFGYNVNPLNLNVIQAKIKNYDMYLRGSVNVVQSSGITLTFNVSNTLYWLVPNKQYDFVYLEESYTLVHNEYIALNPNTKEIIKRNISSDTTLVDEVVLALNVDNTLALGVLKDFVVGTNKEKQPEKVMTPKYEMVDLGINGFQSLTIVDNELWVGFASSDDHIGWNAINRYNIDDFTLIGTISHQFGHLNTLDYNPEIDSLILGNGSSDATLPLKVTIVPNVSDLKTQSDVIWDTLEKTVIDLSVIDEIKAQAVWGDSNLGQNNIFYLITEDNRKIRKCLLGKGLNNYEYGTFIEGKTNEEFNGTMKVLETYEQNENYGVNGGAEHHNGKIYAGVGHDIVRACEFTFDVNKGIQTKSVYIPFVKPGGTNEGAWTAGIAIKNQKVYQGFVGSVSGVLIYDYPF